MKRLNKNNYNFTLRLYNKKGKLVSITRTHKIGRLANAIRRANFRITHSKAYLKVNYGKHKDNFGKIVPFINEGEYTTKTDLLQAWRIFIAE